MGRRSVGTPSSFAGRGLTQAASDQAAASLAAAKGYVDRSNVAVKMLFADTTDTPGLRLPATSSDADKLAAIAWNTNLIQTAMLANPNAVVKLDPSQAWPAQVNLDELVDTSLTPGLDRRLEGRLQLVRGTRSSASDATAGRITAAPAVRLVRRAGNPIAVTAVDAIQLGPNLPGSGVWTQFVTGLGFASGYNRFKTGQALFLRSNDYYAWAFRAVNANTVWKATWVPVGGLMFTITGYSLTALNTALGLTGGNVLTSTERRVLVGQTSGVTALIQGDSPGTIQVVTNGVSGDFTAGETIKDQATGATIGTFGSMRVLMAGKVNTTYPTNPVVQISSGGVIDLSGITIECDGDPDDFIPEWNRCDAIDVWGGVDVDVRANIKAGYAAGVILRSCYRWYADLKCQQLPNHALETAAQEGAYGYLLRLIGACDTGAARLRGSYLRHMLTTNGAGATYNGAATGYQNFWNYGPGARNVVVTGMGSRCYGQAWDTHEGAEDITFFDHVTLYPFSAARAITGPDGAVVRGFGIRHVNPWFVGCVNGINDGGVALDSGGLVYTNEVLGGTIEKFQGIGLSHSDFFSLDQGRILWRNVDLRADKDILSSANRQTIGMLIQSGLVRTEGCRISGVNYAYVQHKSTDSTTGNTLGRVVHKDMTWDGTDAKALSGLRQESEFAAVDIDGLGVILGTTRPTFVVRAFVPSAVQRTSTPSQADTFQAARGNATPIRYKGVRFSFATSSSTTPGLLENNTVSSVTAAVTATPIAYLGESAAAGASAYELAVAGGYAGTQAQWIASLAGAPGATGPQGPGSVGAGIPSGMDAISPYVRVGANAGMNAPTGGGSFYAYPYPIRVATTITALVAQVATLATGGAVSAKMGVWNDNGSGFPDLAAGPIFTGAVDVTTAAAAKRVLPWATTLQPGTYWVGFLYVETSAPTTRPSLYLVNSASWNLALPAASSFANAVGGWKWTGVADYPTSMTGVGLAGSNDAPVMALRGA